MAFYGTRYSEIIDGTGSRDVIYARGGSDDVYGYGGDDDLYGGGGGDFLFGGSGRDWLWGGPGVNDLWGGGGADRFIMSDLPGTFSDDWIGDFQFDVDKIDVRAWGVSDFSQLDNLFRTDGNGDAWLNAFYNGYDHFLTIAGVTANELIASDFIYDQSGARNDSGTDFDDVMFGSRYGDKLNALGGDDIVLGGRGNDLLIGGRSNDELFGGAGHDRLAGSTGKDYLSGGAGEDIFVFNSITNSPNGSGADVITDFNDGDDLIDLSRIDANANVDWDQDFNFIGSAPITGAAQLNYVNKNGNTIISVSVDGDDSSEFQLIIEGVFKPVASDFIL